jgi:preprotein translocase subunit SecF
VIELIPPGTNFDFIGKWKACVIGSILLIVIGFASIPIRGLHWGIDFAGGTEMVLRFVPEANADEGKIRAVVEAAGVSEPSVIRYGEEGSSIFLVRFSGGGELAAEGQNQFVDRIKAQLTEKVGQVTIERVEFVGPKVGAELRTAGLKAFCIAFGLILVYVAVRFTWSFAPGTVIALIHDVLATSAIWILLGQQFDLQVLAALLAIAGYSLNDTIIIYDRIREMMHVHTTQDLPDVINRSVNQTLSRTLLTSGLTMITVLSLLFLGGEAIFSFSAAMAIGIVIGSYSSIYIAAPIMLLLERRREAREKAPTKKGKGGNGRARAKATA